MAVKKTIIKQYLSSGKNLTLLSTYGKRPILNSWTKKFPSEESLYRHEGNIGWVIGKGDLVVDVDPKNNGVVSFKKLCGAIGVELEPTVLTPSGGFHCYLKVSGFEGLSFRKTIVNEYPGIDFLTEGAQCAIPGSITAKGEYKWADDLMGFEQASCPKKLKEIVSFKRGSLKEKVIADQEDFSMGSGIWAEDKVLELLNKLDPSMEYESWMKVGMALHNWDPNEGLRLWEEWSQLGVNYEEGATYVKWKSFNTEGNGRVVTLGSVSHMAMRVDFREKQKMVLNYCERIRVATEEQLEFEIAKEISKEDLSKFDQERLVKAFQVRMFELSGVKMSVGMIRNMITKAHGRSVELAGRYIQDRPDWCKKYMYITSHGGFVNLETFSVLKSEAFNVMNGDKVPYSDGGTKCSAVKYVSDNGFVPGVEMMAYLPMCEPGVVTVDGNDVLNSFKHNSVPEAEAEYSAAGARAIKMVENHIKMLMGSDENAWIFTSWLAHQVQFPGVKILWAPVIQSIEGVGKSFFGEMLRKCLGDMNVGTVNPSQVTSDFNAWSTGSCVNILEELRVKGHNRYEVVNALKPLITDRMIQVNDKGIRPYMTYNTCNYLCFTNYVDALPLTKDDRRWWVIFVPFASLKDVEEYAGMSVGDYYPKLFDGIRRFPGEFRKWLLEYPVTDEFLAIKQAPMTEDKRMMIASEDIEFEGLEAATELLNFGGKFFNQKCLSSSDFWLEFEFQNPEIILSKFDKNKLLKKMGFKVMPDPVKLEGKARRIWVRKPMSAEQIRAAFL